MEKFVIKKIILLCLKRVTCYALTLYVFSQNLVLNGRCYKECFCDKGKTVSLISY